VESPLTIYDGSADDLRVSTYVDREVEPPPLTIYDGSADDLRVSTYVDREVEPPPLTRKAS
jgi:hypothetical protein